VRCAIDTGGTFTDLALEHEDEIAPALLEVEHRSREIAERLARHVLGPVSTR
jgi:N-methylhydantoinase A/oxoprolinase/acetone carboxylase beta subunit